MTCVYIYIYTHYIVTCVYIYIYIYTHSFIHTYIHKYIHTHAYAFIYVFELRGGQRSARQGLGLFCVLHTNPPHPHHPLFPCLITSYDSIDRSKGHMLNQFPCLMNSYDSEDGSKGQMLDNFLWGVGSGVGLCGLENSAQAPGCAGRYILL